VGIGGLPCRSAAIRRLARRQKLSTIEDAAHTFGASIDGIPIGRWADATAFSFYSTKNLCIGEGGMVVTDRTPWSRKMRILSRHGISRGTWDRFGSRGWAYDVTEQGYKYNMSDLLAAVGRTQLGRFTQLQKKRERVNQWYRTLAMDLDMIQFPEPPSGSHSAHHLLLVRLTDPYLIKQRDKILDELTQRGIGMSVHFIPLHLMTHFGKHYGYKAGDFPQAEATYRATMSLPFFPEMTRKDVQYVVESLREVLHRLG